MTNICLKRKQTMHSRVDWMIKLLETPEAAISQDIASEILKKARDAQAWQKESLSLEQLDAKITEIDKLMFEAIKRGKHRLP